MNGIENYPDCREVIPPMGQPVCRYRSMSGQCGYRGACYAQYPPTDAGKDLAKVAEEINKVLMQYRPK